MQIDLLLDLKAPSGGTDILRNFRNMYLFFNSYIPTVVYDTGLDYRHDFLYTKRGNPIVGYR